MDQDARNRVVGGVFTPRPRLQKPRPTTFAETELDLLDCYIAGLEVCDVNVDIEFARYFGSISSFFPLGLPQTAIAKRLCVTTKTLQCWARGEHLPYPVPRKAYAAELMELLRERRMELAGSLSFELTSPVRQAQICQLLPDNRTDPTIAPRRPQSRKRVGASDR